MIYIGINGLGRIGKCILIQLINNNFKHIKIKAINIPDFNIENLESYLNNDSTHKYLNNFKIEIINENLCKINNHKIHILNNRDASKLNWRSLNKLQTTYIKALPKEINTKTKRIHTVFNQAVASTG